MFDGPTGRESGRVADLPSAHGLVSGPSAAWLVAGRGLVRLRAPGSAQRFDPCAGDVVAAASEAPDGHVVVACGAQALVRLDPETGARSPLPFGAPDPQEVIRVVAAGPAGAVAVGTDRGHVAVLDPAGTRSHAALGAAVAGLSWTADGSRLVVHLRQGSPAVLHGETGALLGRLPGRVGSVVAQDGPSGLRFDGPQGGTWDLSPLRPVVLGDGAGITGVAVGAGGAVVVARGDGSLDRTLPATGARAGHQRGSTRPLKGVTRMPGGDRFAVVGVEGGLRVVAADLSRATPIHTVVGRRVAAVGEGLVVLRYSGPGARVTPDGASLPPLAPDGAAWFDLGADPAAKRAAALADDGTVWHIPAAGAAVSLGSFPGARAVDATAAGGAVLSIDGGELVIIDPSGGTRRLPEPGGPVVDLAVSPDDRRVALGGLDGVVRVVDLTTGRTVAVLEGHRESASALVWTSDEALLSGSWDGTVRAWSLASLSTPATALVTELEGAWGLDVAAALAAVGP